MARGTGVSLQLIKTTNRGSHCFPEGEQQTHLREGFLATGEGFGTTTRAVIFRDIRLNLYRDQL